MKCFYVPGSRSLIDTMTAEGFSAISNETLEQVQQRHPGAQVWDLDTACGEIYRLTHEALVSPPVEITQERWNEMLNIMPPIKWRNGGDSTESFMVCEATAIDLHSIFCRIGQRYFELCDTRHLTHLEIVTKCHQLIAREAIKPMGDYPGQNDGICF